MNKFIGIGRLTEMPQLRYTNGGKAVCKFTVAINEGKDRDPLFLPVACWEKLAEIVANNLDKGRLVAVEGSIQIRSYEDDSGVKRKATELTARTVQFLDRGKEKTGTDDGPDDDLDI
jgi:single-strand DNA-binding protein